MGLNYFHSVVLKPEKCIGCTYCLKICPTEAIRLKDGKANIIAERCIDCGECIRICPNHAKSAVADGLEILKKFKYNIALTVPILYGQFGRSTTPQKVLSSLRSLGFDEVADTTSGSEIVDVIGQYIVENSPIKPVINSSCAAILRLIQVRFPELINNVLDIETPIEITARLAKTNAVKTTGLPLEDIGVILITPCTARVTSIKSPLGIDFSYIDGSIPLKDVYGPILKILANGELPPANMMKPTSDSLLWYNTGGQMTGLNSKDTLAVSGINNVISVLEDAEMGKLSHLSFLELTACPGGCLGGPLVVEKNYIALNNLENIAAGMNRSNPAKSDIDNYFNMYKSDFIRFTKKIEPRTPVGLGSDIETSIKKMDVMNSIFSSLPGINCGICGAPTCQAFCEDVVTGTRSDSHCPVIDIIKKSKNISDS